MAEGKLIKLVDLADRWIAQKTGKPLADVQRVILRQALEGQRLKDIQVPGYSPNTVKSEIAPKLWKQLSDVTGKKVTIKTVRLVLEDLGEKGAEERGYNVARLTKDIPHDLSPAIAPSGVPLLELPGGQIPLNSKFYIKRLSVESPAYEEIAKPGSLIRIKAPKKMGKTSLMARLLHHAEQQGCQSVSLNLELADSESFTALDKFLRQFFCASAAKALQLPVQLDKYWDKDLGRKVNCTNYFEEYLLPAINKPLALALDKVDLIFPHRQITDDFFGLLRAWHENAQQSHSIWRNFRLIIVHGTEVYIPLSNDQSPFNVGLGIELPEFDALQVQELAQLHGLDFSEEEVNRLMAMIGGHPHLIRTALYKIARREITLEQFLKEAPTDTGIYADYLRLHLWHLKQNPEFSQALKRVIESDSPVELESVVKFRLNSIGLVNLQGDRVTIRNELYRRYFRDRLLEANSYSPQGFSFQKPETLPNLGENILTTLVFTDAKYLPNNSDKTLTTIFQELNLMTKLCQQFEGQVLKSRENGLVMCFMSAVKAVKCAQEIQKALALIAKDLPEIEFLEHRIGIHLAEVFFKENDIHGDGVKIASRLQLEAIPGKICISSAVYEAVKSHLQLRIMGCEYRDLQEIKEPILIYQISP